MNLMYACDYLEKGVLNTLLGVTFPAPSKCYLALYLSDPGESGTAGTEVSYPGYQRMEVQFSPPADASGEHAVYYYAIYRDGKKETEIDPVNFICLVNGVDYLAEVRKALGK